MVRYRGAACGAPRIDLQSYQISVLVWLCTYVGPDLEEYAGAIDLSMEFRPLTTQDLTALQQADTSRHLGSDMYHT